MGGNIGEGMASVHGVTNGSGAAGVAQKRSDCAVRRYFARRYLPNNFPNLLKKVGIGTHRTHFTTITTKQRRNMMMLILLMPCITFKLTFRLFLAPGRKISTQ
jgi:hypothetical protein